jgi:5-methylthioribose kinase
MPKSTQLDIEQPDALLNYLRSSGRIAADEQPRIRVLGGGVSNRTVLVERASGEAWVLKQALAKLRVAVEWFSSPERIEREALGLQWLARIAPPGTTTPLVFVDPRRHVLAMRAVPQPHENWKQVLLQGRLEREHVGQFGRLLGAIHCASHEHAGQLRRLFDDRSFFESLRIEPYYVYTWTQIPESAQFYDALIADTRARRLALTHGDYSPKNILIHAGRLILLDHEVIHFGDPAFDVGFALSHLLSKAHHLPALRQQFAAAAEQFWHEYRGALAGTPWAGELEQRVVRHALGCLLARVAGRSTLEYLDAAERIRQRDAVLAIISPPPATVAGLTRQFVAQLAI